MKSNRPINWMPTGLKAVALAALGAAATAGAATPTLNGRIELRPFTPTDKTIYGMPSAETSGGLSTTPIGEPVYLDAQVNIAIPPSDITNVSWSLSSQPIGSTAALTNSPLGTNIPVYLPSDALVLQTAGRAMLRPDVRGQYTVQATIATASYGTTNVTQMINAGVYMGAQTCELCHSGGEAAPDIYHEWVNTLHASKFTRGINGQIAGYGKGCISCHTVGYDTSPLAVNGGFDDVATQLGWTFPIVLTNSNWADMQANYPKLANLANIQCENCHGPGSEHAYSLGDTNLIAVNWHAGNCGQCHDATTHHIKVPEWKNSKHATPPTISGPSRLACVGCHTAMGFAGLMKGSSETNTAFEPISCVACHDPHDATNPHQLRNVGPVTLADGTVVTNYGNGELCMNCHHGRVGPAETAVQNYKAGLPNWAGGSTLSLMAPQADMFLGVNGETYGKNIPSSAHRDSVTEACVTCHMQPSPASTAPGFLLVGGHTFSLHYTNGATNILMTGACAQCHGSIDTFDLVRQDFNGDGVIEGVQTEVQHLLDQLSALLPNASGVIDGLVKSKVSMKTTWSLPQLRAAYNWRFVSDDGSHGVHNVAYAVGLLKASIADLTGNSTYTGPLSASDLAYYAWEVQYFGSASDPNAAPNATPAGDGIPNWLKYSLGINPLVPGTTNTLGGIVWADGTALGGNTSTNAIQIYTAAEVTFNTQVGTNYQVQAVSSLSSGWQNVSDPIPGTGAAVSYLTPTRNNVQQFFRVVHTP